ncbi:MAG TPA: YoaK family protein [Streptosporangiaceae bacterium]|nr:YoaK family protein [Streptosporangiaceae bacterium]
MSAGHTASAAGAGQAGEPFRDSLVVLLAVGSGVADVTTFLVLGKVFSSVITGNLVLFGLALASAQPRLALHSGLAVAGYSAGVLIGVPIAARGRHDRVWAPGVTAALCAELCLLAAFTIAWEVARQRTGWQIAMLLLLAAAMGVQSAAVRRLGDMSATYLTGTLTGVLSGLITGTSKAGRWRDLSVLVAVVAGACAGAALTRTVPDWLPAATLLPLGTVIAAASTFRRRTEAAGT